MSIDLVPKLVPLLDSNGEEITVDFKDTTQGDDIMIRIVKGVVYVEVMIENSPALSKHNEFNDEYHYDREDEVREDRERDLVDIFGEEK